MAKPVVIITGSSGLIGYPLCEQLSDEFDIVGFDRDGPPHPPSRVDCVSVDLRSDESVRQAFSTTRQRHDGPLAAVIHLAAYYDFSGAPSPLYDEITVRGTERLLRALQDYPAELFVFSSTMLVHKPGKPGEYIQEESPVSASWPYPASKIKTEAVIQEKHGQTRAVSLRIAGLYTDRCHSIPIAHHVQRIYENQLTSHFFPGQLDHGQSFVHLQDVLDALIACVHHRKKLPEETAILIGEAEPLSFIDLQNQIARLLGHSRWLTIRIPKWLAAIGAWVQDQLLSDSFIKPWMIERADDHYALDIARARQLLGWEPKHTLAKTLPKMIQALQADPPAWYKENNLKSSRHLKKP